MRGTKRKEAVGTTFKTETHLHMCIFEKLAVSAHSRVDTRDFHHHTITHTRPCSFIHATGLHITMKIEIYAHAQKLVKASRDRGVQYGR